MQSAFPPALHAHAFTCLSGARAPRTAGGRLGCCCITWPWFRIFLFPNVSIGTWALLWLGYLFLRINLFRGLKTHSCRGLTLIGGWTKAVELQIQFNWSWFEAQTQSITIWEKMVIYQIIDNVKTSLIFPKEPHSALGWESFPKKHWKYISSQK